LRVIKIRKLVKNILKINFKIYLAVFGITWGVAVVFGNPEFGFTNELVTLSRVVFEIVNQLDCFYFYILGRIHPDKTSIHHIPLYYQNTNSILITL